MTRPVGAVLTLGGSAVVVAGLGWLTLVLAGRLSGPGVYADLAAWWSLYFTAGSVLVGLQQEVTRSQLQPGGPPRHAREVLTLSLPLAVVAWLGLLGLTDGLGVAVGILLFTATVIAVVVLVLTSEVLGLLAAQARWSALAGIGVADAALRLVLVLACVAWWPQPLGYGLAMIGSVVVFAPLVARGSWRFGRGARYGGPGFTGRAGAVMVGAACLGVLSVGTPALVEVLAPRADTALAPLFAALVMLRSPVLMAAISVRPLLLQRLASRVDARIPLAPLGGALLVLLSLAAGLSWAGGPWLTELVFGIGFRPDPVLAAAIGTSGVLLAAMTLVATALVARNRAHAATAGWVVATGLTVVCLLAPVAWEQRIALALVLGPVAGLAVQATSVRSG